MSTFERRIKILLSLPKAGGYDRKSCDGIFGGRQHDESGYSGVVKTVSRVYGTGEGRRRPDNGRLSVRTETECGATKLAGRSGSERIGKGCKNRAVYFARLRNGCGRRIMTVEKIREDLKEIRYYYSRKELFDEGTRCVAPNSILEKVRRYNDAVKTAPPKLYDLYISLYVKNNTQEGLAYDMHYTSVYIYLLNKKLLQFLKETMKEP